MKHPAPSETPFRKGLPSQVTRKLSLVRGGQARLLKTGDTLFHEGDERERIFVVESGWLKLSRTLSEGQRQIVGFPTRGAILGFEGPLDHVNHCEALTATVVHAFPVSALIQLCHDPRFGGTLLRQLGMQLGAAQTQLTSLGAQSAAQRTAAFLIFIADSCFDDEREFTLPMRRIDVAEFLGLRLETVSRMFGSFQQRGWISMQALYQCRITNRRALAALASGSRTMKSFPLPSRRIAANEY